MPKIQRLYYDFLHNFNFCTKNIAFSQLFIKNILSEYGIPYIWQTKNVIKMLDYEIAKRTQLFYVTD